MPLYPLRKLHPSYQNGRRKPSGLLELDLSLDLAQQCRHFYVPQKIGKCKNLGYDKKSVDLIAVESGNQYKEGFAATSTPLQTHSAYSDFGYPFTLYTRFVCKQTISSGTLPLSNYGDFSQSDYVAATVSPFVVRGQINLNFTAYVADVVTSAHKTVGAVTDLIFECISSTEKVAHVWVDGKYIGSSTNSTDSSSKDAALTQFDETHPVIGGSGSTYFDVICTGLFDGRIVNKDEFVRNPYQLLKPSIDVLWFLGGGGTNYNVSASFGLSQGLTQSGTAQALGGITLANSITCSDAANGNYQSASTLANQLSVSNGGLAQALSAASMTASLGYSTDGIIAFLVDVSFSSTMGDTYSGIATGQGAINLGTSLDQTVSAIAQTIASVTLSTNQGLTSSSGNTIAGAISLGVSSGMTALGSFTIGGSITLSKTLADSINANAQADASVNLGAQIGLTVLAQAAAQAGITLSQVVSVVNTAATIIFGVTAPDGRVYTVEIDTRSLVVSAENRTLTIDSEDRTLTVN